MVPESIEVGAQRIDARWIQLVESPGTDSAIDHQVRVLEDPQVLRDRRPAHRKVASQLTDRQGAVQEPFEDRATGRIAQGIHLRVWVSNH